MRALEFITGHEIYTSTYTYKFQLKTTIDGVNAFHLAARFHAQSLITIVKFLRQNDILEHVSPLLLGPAHVIWTSS